MSSRTDRTAGPDVPVPTPDEVEQYRAMVASLMERCLDRIRRTPIWNRYREQLDALYDQRLDLTA